MVQYIIVQSVSILTIASCAGWQQTKAIHIGHGKLSNLHQTNVRIRRRATFVLQTPALLTIEN
jgi:hypothetical protein